MNIGKVRTFPNVKASKEQALKIIEEAAEVFSAWEDFNKTKNNVLHLSYAANPSYRNLLNECADVIQAVSNLAAALGVSDFSPFMEECQKRNELRGRYDIH